MANGKPARPGAWVEGGMKWTGGEEERKVAEKKDKKVR
jgi:hypothetical protein